MRVRVRINGDLRRYLSGPLRERGGWVDVFIDRGTTLKALAEKFGVPWTEVGVASVNRTLADPERLLADGDEVDLYAPIGGG